MAVGWDAGVESMRSDLGEWWGAGPSLRKEMTKISQYVDFHAMYEQFVRVDQVFAP